MCLFPGVRVVGCACSALSVCRFSGFLWVLGSPGPVAPGVPCPGLVSLGCLALWSRVPVSSWLSGLVAVGCLVPWSSGPGPGPPAPCPWGPLLRSRGLVAVLWVSGWVWVPARCWSGSRSSQPARSAVWPGWWCGRGPDGVVAVLVLVAHPPGVRPHGSDPRVRSLPGVRTLSSGSSHPRVGGGRLGSPPGGCVGGFACVRPCLVVLVHPGAPRVRGWFFWACAPLGFGVSDGCRVAGGVCVGAVPSSPLHSWVVVCTCRGFRSPCLGGVILLRVRGVVPVAWGGCRALGGSCRVGCAPWVLRSCARPPPPFVRGMVGSSRASRRLVASRVLRTLRLVTHPPLGCARPTARPDVHLHPRSASAPPGAPPDTLARPALAPPVRAALTAPVRAPLLTPPPGRHRARHLAPWGTGRRVTCRPRLHPPSGVTAFWSPHHLPPVGLGPRNSPRVGGSNACAPSVSAAHPPGVCPRWHARPAQVHLVHPVHPGAPTDPRARHAHPPPKGKGRPPGTPRRTPGPPGPPRTDQDQPGPPETRPPTQGDPTTPRLRPQPHTHPNHTGGDVGEAAAPHVARTPRAVAGPHGGVGPLTTPTPTRAPNQGPTLRGPRPAGVRDGGPGRADPKPTAPPHPRGQSASARRTRMTDRPRKG